MKIILIKYCLMLLIVLVVMFGLSYWLYRPPHHKGGDSLYDGSSTVDVGFSPAPVFSLDARIKNLHIVPSVMEGNVTSVSFANVIPGFKFSIDWQQPQTGSPFFVDYGGSVVDSCVINTIPSSITRQYFTVDAQARIVGDGCTTSGEFKP